MTKIALGIDIGGTNIKTALVTDSGELLEHHIQPTSSAREPQDVVNNIVLSVKALTEKNPAKPMGAGVGFAGIIDAVGNVAVTAPNFPTWNRVPFRDLVAEALELPVVLDNDVNAFGLAEHLWGAAKGLKHFIAVAVGTGLGGALFFDGKLYRGANGGAGELGFSILSEKGPDKIGYVGALEAYVGRNAFDQYCAKYFPTGQFPNPKTVTELAEQGDERARAVHKTIAHYLAQASLTWVNILNPEAIIVGGGTVTGAKYFFQEYEKEIREKALKTATADLKILPSGLGYYAGVQGAAALWLSKN